ncbi:hypothetical protein ACHHYP_01554 [Achlya hypogyna]|uniref:Uncharacterized protein n=1 Tax=Achlya hypogyna TaxID=1202772 RepID=A0A1V9Z8J6_ACHHY|nr:hypothetical protein ACHHYP_01554 [Achlya hypogyna]
MEPPDSCSDIHGRATRPPWLADVDDDSGIYGHVPVRDEDALVRCSGILHNGSRCTRTCVLDRAELLHPSTSYCYKHYNQAGQASHSYAPLAVPEVPAPRSQCTCCRRCTHWTTQAIASLCGLSLAIFFLALALALQAPILGIISATFFLVPLVFLGSCLIQMMMHAFSDTRAPVNGV